jgi:hypothetical protein
LGSYRVIKAKQDFFAGFPKYQMAKTPLSLEQVALTYLAWWGIIITLIAFALISDTFLKPR